MPELGFYTVKEVAEILKINRISVYDLIKEGKLNGHRFSERRIRVSEKDLNEFINKAKKTRINKTN